METEVMTKEVFMELIDKAVGKNEVIIFTNRLENVKVLSEKKKTYAKSFSSVYPADLFKNPNGIADLVNSKLLGIVISDYKNLNEKLQAQFKEIKKNEKSKKSN